MTDLYIKGALIWQGAESVEKDLFIQNGRIVPQKPNHAIDIDLSGYTLFPGLVNAHDHLELNHFPRTKFREVYDNAHQWGEDVNLRLNDEPFKSLRSYPLWDKLFIGGLKNLLCGATTVAHHGPKHKPMYRADFPVRVLKNYGWAHSLHFSTEAEIVQSYQSTPKNRPWFIHLAEGTDEIAASEYQRLKKLGCVGENTVLVHGVGMTEEDIADAAKIVKGLVICPSTNSYLLNKVSASHQWQKKLYLGSDSRLTASNDFLGEIYNLTFTYYTNLQYQFRDKPFSSLLWELIWKSFHQVYENASSSSIIESPNGTKFADIIVYKEQSNLHPFLKTVLPLQRSEFSLIIFNAIPQIGAPELMARFPHIQTVACTLDGVEKRINIELARQIHRCTLKEQGLIVDALPNGKKFIFF